MTSSQVAGLVSDLFLLSNLVSACCKGSNGCKRSSTRSSRKIVLRSQDIVGRWSLGVAEQLLLPVIIIGPSQVAPGSLLQDVGHMEHLQCGQIGGLQALVLVRIWNK